ncbi:MAG: dTDP-4-dehydrorhamnose 3,5-epimerase [Pseudomonadota bacterium]
MEIEETAIAGAVVLTPRRFGDARGWFSETWAAGRMADAGLAHDFVQDNESFSAEAGTVRGLHYQSPPFAQAKLVRVVQGAARDVAVDVRVGSPSYGVVVTVDLTPEDGRQFLVPRGCLHGFATTAPGTLFSYKVDNPYDRASDGSVRWNDPDLGIDWGVAEADAQLSDKDRAAPLFRDWQSPFVWEGAA